MPPAAAANSGVPPLTKVPSGIQGVDEITHGGLPAGRPTLVCGGAGCGKSLFAMEFLVHGARRFGEPGLFVSFEESPEDILANYASLRFGLAELIGSGKIQLLHLPINPRDFEETGPYELEGLFVRLEQAVRKNGARRIALDTIETLFSGFQNQAIVRAELLRLFGWLKQSDLTAVVTGERGDAHLTRQGLEEYVSDCVILMDHRVNEQISTRRLRVVKYRGSLHGTNEYPFLIDEGGISLFPITSLNLTHDAPSERVSTGVAKLDEMLGGSGYYRGSTILISGAAGSGKTSLAAHFADSACRRGEKTLYFAFEESPKQLIRNIRSIGIDLEPWVDSGGLKIEAARASIFGLELHLLTIHRLVQEHRPDNVVIDPFTNFTSVGSSIEIELMLSRLIDFLKANRITTVLTSLTTPGSPLESSEAGVSAWIDTWLLLQEIESVGERNRGLYVLKSRGMAHSNQIREFRITSHGVQLIDPYLGPAGIFTGSARMAQEARERAQQVLRLQEHEREQSELEQKEVMLRAQMATVEAELKSLQVKKSQAVQEFRSAESELAQDRVKMAESRRSGSVHGPGGAGRRKAG